MWEGFVQGCSPGYKYYLSAVTTADVQRVAQDWLVEDRRTVGWYVPG
jgi:hypothetical protein